MKVPDSTILEKHLLNEASTTHNYGENTDRTWKEVVFSPGRFQPVHAGHEDMIRELIQFAKKKKAEPVIVVVAGSKVSEKNPLSGESRRRYLQGAFKGIRIIVADNPYKATEAMFDQGMKPVGIVAGSDRVKQYKVVGAFYNIDGFDVKGLTRDPEAEGSASFSATKVREAAASGDLDAFSKMMPKRMSTSAISQMYKEVRKGMGVK